MSCSTAQRELIDRLMRRRELDMHRCTIMHEFVAHQAKIPPPASGLLVDDWIRTLTIDEASALIQELRQ